MISVVSRSAAYRAAVMHALRDLERGANPVLIVDLDTVSLKSTLAQVPKRSHVIATTAVTNDKDRIMCALEHGADAVVIGPSPAALAKTVEVVQQVAAGESGLIVTASPEELLRPKSHGGLSVRDLPVLRLLQRGMTNTEIGVETSQSEMAVRAVIKRILRTLGMQTRTQAAVWATQHLANGERYPLVPPP